MKNCPTGSVTFYDIQRCEAPEQPKSRRGGAIERLLMKKGLLARRDGLYARRTPDRDADG